MRNLLRYQDLAKDLLLEKEKLFEKLILFNDGANYGQVVWMAGGIGSGKSFTMKNFIEFKKFRVIDPDKFKKLYQKLHKATGKYSEIGGLDMSNPEDATKLHNFVKRQGVKNKFIHNLIMGGVKSRLPNIMFDSQIDEIDKLTQYYPLLKNVGYEDQNMHLVWVLTDYSVSVKRNRNRDRVAPDDVVLSSHKGNAETFIKFLKNGLPQGIDGSVRVILNNPEHTIFYRDRPSQSKSTKPEKLPRNIYKKAKDVEKDTDGDYFIIDDFKYLTLKEAGKPFKNSRSIKKQLYTWIMDNAPKTADIWKLMRKS